MENRDKHRNTFYRLLDTLICSHGGRTEGQRVRNKAPLPLNGFYSRATAVNNALPIQLKTFALLLD